MFGHTIVRSVCTRTGRKRLMFPGAPSSSAHSQGGLALRRLMRGEVVLLVAITLALGAPGGAPWYHPDSIIVRAMHVLAHGGDPNFFHYPGFVIYADALLYGVVYAGLAASHSVAGMAAFQQCFAAGVFPNGMPFHVPALILTYAFSAAGIVLTNRLAWELSGDRALAFIAALIPATSLLWGVETHFATVDLPMTTLVLATLLATVRATRAGAPMSRRTPTIGSGIPVRSSGTGLSGHQSVRVREARAVPARLVR